MKGSRYNIEIPAGDHFLLYNTLHGSCTEVPVGEIDEVRQALRTPSVARADIIDALAAQLHVVEDDLDEFSIVANRHQAGIADRHRLDVTINTTMDCNLGCVYCYEQRVKGSRMQPRVEVAIRRWLEREIPSATMVLLHWFGGEPLLDVPLIERMSRHARAVARSSGTAMSLHATTNGYLLTSSRRRALVDAGVRDFQVTLDGPAATHDRSRPTLGGHGSFQRIFTNICETLREHPDVGMSLRVNINHLNIGRVPELLTTVPPDLRQRLRLALEPVFGDASVSATANISGHELSEAMRRLYDLAADLGFDTAAGRTALLTGRLTYCYAERQRQVVINYDGRVFKCTAGSFRPQDALGVLDDTGRVRSHDGAWERWMKLGDYFPATCTQCPYLPLCMGGCRRARAESPNTCTLVPTNAAAVLKHLGFTGALPAHSISSVTPAVPSEGGETTCA